jgi:serine/threonine-protein kinase
MASSYPRTIGRYQVNGVLGRGGMGIVYRAVDPIIDRVVAIKTIRLTLSQEELELYEARFAQEIKAVGKLNDPHIVTVYDVGRTDEYAYMAMEFIDGPELAQLMTGMPLDIATSVQIIAQVADGLGVAHSRGIVHRDVKPSNIMIANGAEGLVAKITDFGIARVPTSSLTTKSGTILGSPRYMSPEQVQGKEVSPRSDIFSLGVILYEMLAGIPPFDADSVNSIMYQTVNVAEKPLSDTDAGVPRVLAEVVSRALAKSEEARFQSMRELSNALRAIARNLPDPMPRVLTRSVKPPGSVPDVETSEPTPHRLSSAFDSFDGARRFAEMSGTMVEFTRMIHLRPPPPTGVPAQAQVDGGSALAEGPPASAPPRASEAFPVVPAVMLATLILVMLTLGIALAL